MTKKYIDLATLLNNNIIIINNERIAEDNLKFFKRTSDNSEYDKYYDKNKKLVEIFLKNNLRENNYFDTILEKTSTDDYRDIFSNLLVKFNENNCQRPEFIDKLKNNENKPIDIAISIIYSNDQTLEESRAIGYQPKRILRFLYIVLDFKNWAINIGAEKYITLLSLFKRTIGYSKDDSLYAELNINLRPKSLKDIFDYDYGISFNETYEIGGRYYSKSKSKSFKDDS